MTIKPIRIQRKRTKGYRMPPNTVSVCRPGKWGNPFRVGETFKFKDGSKLEVPNNNYAVKYYKIWLSCWNEENSRLKDEARKELHGKNLACYCPLDQPCHADVLLKIANPEIEKPEAA